MILNKAHIEKSIKLTNAQRLWFAQFTEEELVIMASVLHGARISASSYREKAFKLKLQAKFVTTTIQQRGEWDFVITDSKLAIDLKSPGFDHNTPVASWVQKYIKALPVGYTGIFVIQELPNMPYTMHWPVAELASFGFHVMSETEFERSFL